MRKGGRVGVKEVERGRERERRRRRRRRRREEGRKIDVCVCEERKGKKGKERVCAKRNQENACLVARTIS